MRKFKYGCGVIAQNFLLNYSLFKITANPCKKVEFSSEKQKDMSVDGIWPGQGFYVELFLINAFASENQAKT